jgi:hypothetical protein
MDSLESNEQYYLDLFRLGLQCDRHARQLLQNCLREVVLKWLCLHPKKEEAYRFEKEEYYLIQSFERFWQTSINHDELEFNTLADMLRYLQATLNAVIMDTVRIYCRSKESVEPTDPGKPVAAISTSSDEVWKKVSDLLSGKHERRLAYLFHCGLKPREIVSLCPQEFNDVAEISRLRHYIIEQVLLNQVNAL